MAAKGPIEKILVRSPNWLGDAAMAVPALRELSRIFPDAAITLTTNPGVEGLFEDADFIDHILPLEKRTSRIKQTMEQADRLMHEDFDLAVILPNSFESALSVRMAKIPRRIGYNKDLRGLLLTDPVAVPEWKNRRHEVFYYLNLVAEAERRYLGRSTVGETEPDTALCVSADRQEAARQTLRAAGADLSKPVIALGAGSTNSMAKRWGSARFADLNDRLCNELNAETFLVGAASETDVTQEVVRLSGSKPIDLAGKTTVAEAAALLSVAELLVANDMGLSHAAPAVGTPTITIFGPTNPITTRPYSVNAVVIRNEVECSPCMLRECPIDHRCMTGVTVEHVMMVCHRMLSPSIE